MTTPTITNAPPAPGTPLSRLKNDARFVKTRDGVESFGMYVEFARYLPTTGAFYDHYRVFTLENSVSVYNRRSERKSGRWTTEYRSDFIEAAVHTQNLIRNLVKADGKIAVMRGDVLIVQATISDLVVIRAKGKHGPDCRWRGINEIERKCGKFQDAPINPTDFV